MPHRDESVQDNGSRRLAAALVFLIWIWIGCSPVDHLVIEGAQAASVVETPTRPSFQDGPVFVGRAPELPGSSATLVLEKDYEQTRMLRWLSADVRIGSAEVDFFEPREWMIEGDPPALLTFGDRSPGPILHGKIQLSPGGRGIVHVVLGKDRVTYALDRVDRD